MSVFENGTLPLILVGGQNLEGTRELGRLKESAPPGCRVSSHPRHWLNRRKRAAEENTQVCPVLHQDSGAHDVRVIGKLPHASACDG